MKTGDSGLTIFRLLCKDNRWQWVQACACVVYKDGQPDYIVSNLRPLMDSEGIECFQKKATQFTRFTLPEAASLYECSRAVPPQIQSQTVKAECNKFQGQCASKAMQDAMKCLSGTEHGLSEMLAPARIVNAVERNKSPAGFCGEPLAGSNTKAAGESVGSRTNGKTYPVNSSLDVALEGLEEMLQSYGLTPEDLELGHQDELIKHIVFDDLNSELNPSSSPNDLSSEVESLSGNISSFIEHSLLTPASDDWHSVQSSSLCSSNSSNSVTTTDVVSPSSQLYLPEQS
ncbi:uncharacterized protein LOC121279986 isoform X2 [Carcharodon carcharias]|nr:uncharacterized protein LOC121279986 isoform X2 [Carcharodon carcharias]